MRKLVIEMSDSAYYVLHKGVTSGMKFDIQVSCDDEQFLDVLRQIIRIIFGAAKFNKFTN